MLEESHTNLATYSAPEVVFRGPASDPQTSQNRQVATQLRNFSEVIP